MAGSCPLEQRQSSRVARRAGRFKESSDEPNQSNQTTAPRGPSDKLERRIAESVEKRKASNIIAAANEQMYKEEKTEILGKYEYLDHTADVQIHATGSTFDEALEQLTLGLFGYMTKVSLVEINETDSKNYGSDVKVVAHDLASLVFAFLQEWLSIFHENHFIPRKVVVHSVDIEKCVIVSSGRGEIMKLDKHIQGTEVKAVTYSNLQVLFNEDDGSADIWIIVDI